MSERRQTFIISGDITASKPSKERTLEKCYLPMNDPELLRAGIDVCARTKVKEGKVISNEIVFKRGGKEAVVKCTHTAIEQVALTEEDPMKLRQISVSVEGLPEIKELISPDDYFWSTSSYVEGLTQLGIMDTILKGMVRRLETGVEPIDMNPLMRQQIANALTKIAPDEGVELVKYMLDYIVANDPQRLELFSGNYEDAICNHFEIEDMEALDKIDGGIRYLSPTILDCMALSPDLSKDMTQKLLDLHHNGVDLMLIINEGTTMKLRNKLLETHSIAEAYEYIEEMDDLPESTEIVLREHSIDLYREALSRRDNLREETIDILAEDSYDEVSNYILDHHPLSAKKYDEIFKEESWFLGAIAGADLTPDEIVEKLARNEDSDIRLIIAGRADLFDAVERETIELLINDDNFYVRKAIKKNVAENLLPSQKRLKEFID